MAYGIIIECDELQIFAYSMETGIVIVAETFSNQTTFNRIEVCVPNLNGIRLARESLSRSGGSDYANFNL